MTTGVGSQGIFAYHRDRLIQAGGWCGLWGNRPEVGLARVQPDLAETALAHVTINPEKSVWGSPPICVEP